MIVTVHAVERYIQRIAPTASYEEARACIEASSRAIDAAAAFGCHIVRQACGAKLVLVEDTVVTVVPDKRRAGLVGVGR